MATRALFIESAGATRTGPNPRRAYRTRVGAALSAIMAALFLLLTITQGAAAGATQKAHAFDVTKWVACSWGADALPGKVYNWTQGSDAQFELLSKSAVSFGVDEVNGGLNSLFVATGQNFEHVNNDIQGFDKDGKKTHEFNTGRQYNFFERFGVAGIQFTSYLGEWKHVVVNACDDDPKPQDPKANHFYDTRLDPQSTWDDISSSKDPRTQLFGRGATDRYRASVANFVANCFLFVTKLIVAMVVSLISFSFQDIGEAFGLPVMLFGEDGKSGFFRDILESVFFPLLGLAGLMFIISLGYAMARGSLHMIFRLMLRFFASLVALLLFMVFPGVVASGPLNIAVLIQSTALQGVTQSLGVDDGLCATGKENAEAKKENTPDYTKNSKNKKDETFGENWGYASRFMRETAASIDCSFVKLFVLEPWVQGQFGTEFNNLWAEEKIPGWAKNGKSLGNANTKQVGDAGVPMGNNEWVTNWALYQMSVQTSAHIPTGTNGTEPAKVSSGVSHDWWRIVDATSNYTEKEVAERVEKPGGPGNWVEVTRGDPDTSKKPLTMWDTWNGTSPLARTSSSFMSMFVAAGALAVPGVLGLITGALSIALQLSVVFLIVCFVFAFGNDAMFQWFLGALSTILKLWVFRVAAGVSLVFSIISVLFVMNSLAQFGWWQSVLMLVLLSAAVWAGKDKIADVLMGFVSFGQDLTSKPAAMLKTMGNMGKATVKTAAAGAISGASAKRSGGSFTRGMVAGAKDKARDLSRQSDTGQRTYRLYSAGKRGAQQGNRADRLQERIAAGEPASTLGGRTHDEEGVCASCANPLALDGTEPVYRDSAGNNYCSICAADDLVPDDAYEIDDYADDTVGAPSPVVSRSRLEGARHVSPLKRLSRGTYRDGHTLEEKPMGEEQARQAYVEALSLARGDVEDARERYAPGAPVVVTVPDELAPYVDADLVAKAWRDRNWDYIRLVYIVAIKKHVQQSTGHDVVFSDERSLKFMRDGE